MRAVIEAPQLLLQRMRTGGDSRRWRTVLVVPLQRLIEASRLVALAEQIDDTLHWRLAADAAGGEVYHWDGGRWIAPAA